MKKPEASATSASAGIVAPTENLSGTNTKKLQNATTVPVDTFHKISANAQIHVNNSENFNSSSVEINERVEKEDRVSLMLLKSDNTVIAVDTIVNNAINEKSIISSSTMPSLEGNNSNGNDRVTVDKKPNKPLIVPDNRLKSSKSDEIFVVGSLDNGVPIVNKNKNSTTIERLRLSSPRNEILTVVNERKRSFDVVSPAPTRNGPESILSVVDPSTEINDSKNRTRIPHCNDTTPDSVDEPTLHPSTEELKRHRAPLMGKYKPYTTHSDTSLEDARKRLQVALDQTRQLRAAFTERLYGKYRICLQPPAQTNDIINTIRNDPNDMYQKLQQEMDLINEDKTVERIESRKLDCDTATLLSTIPIAAHPSSSADLSTHKKLVDPSNPINASNNIDNPEQYTYVTSGLSLVVLPEDDVPNKYVWMYKDRGPINSKTGQKTRGISAAAATSGKIVLHRARQGKSERAELEKLSKIRLGQAHNFFDRHYYSPAPSQSTEWHSGISPATVLFGVSANIAPLKPSSVKEDSHLLQLPAQKITTKSTALRGLVKAVEGKKSAATKRPTGASKSSSKVQVGQTPASAKAIRTKVQASMSLNTLLNLNPVNEELRTDTKYSAATLAMMELGVGSYQGPTTQYHKNTPHRFKHPFPDSLGGRRRPVSSFPYENSREAVSAVTSQKDTFQATQAQVTLPPVPSVRERRRCEKIKVLSYDKAGTSRAKLSIRKILDQFTTSSTVDCVNNSCTDTTRIAVESKSNSTTPGTDGILRDHPKRQRSVSNIGFVRGLYLDSQGEEAKHSNVSIDSSLTLNVLKAVGLIKSSVSGDKNTEKPYFQACLASSLFNENLVGETGSHYSDSVSKLKELELNLSTQKRSFTEAFYSDTEFDSEKMIGEQFNGNVKIIDSTVTLNQINDTKIQRGIPVHPPLSLRGGGTSKDWVNHSDDVKNSLQNQEKRTDGVGLGPGVQNSPQTGIAGKRNRQQIQNQAMSAAVATSTSQANIIHQNMLWEERSKQQRLASLQSPLLSNSGSMMQQHAAGQLQAQLQSDHFRQTNALQLAHQLRLSRLSAHGANDMADYIGGLQRSQAQAQAHAQAQAAYDWSSVGAAAVASSQSLTALGINPNHSGMMPLSVEDRTRVLLAREQQNLAVRVAAAQRQQAVALMRGMAPVDNTPYSQTGYPNIPGQLLNTSAAGLINGQGASSRSINTNNAQSVNQATSKHSAAPQKVNYDSKQPSQADRSSSKDQSVQQHKKGNNVHKIQKEELQNMDNPKAGEQKNYVGFKENSVINKRKASPNHLNEAVPSEKKSRISINQVSSTTTVADESTEKSTNSFSPAHTFQMKSLSMTVNAKTETSAEADQVTSTKQSSRNSFSKQVQDTSSSTVIGSSNSEGKVKNKALSTKEIPGLQYYVLQSPKGISPEFAAAVLAGRCHEVIGMSVYRDLAVDGLRVVKYITSVGMAVPIPKTVVTNALKERINVLLVSESSNMGSMPASSRDIIAAVILMWLWKNEEGCFQRAFVKSGRIDVDPDCKWFVTTAVNKAVSSLSNEITGSMSRATSFATALLAYKNKSTVGSKVTHTMAEDDSLKTAATKVDLLAASIVSKSLNTKLVLNENMVSYHFIHSIIILYPNSFHRHL